MIKMTMNETNNIIRKKETPSKYKYTQNRELSWLKFNQRVLREAADETVPLLEKVKFISIFTSNLDEFYMIRCGSLYDISLVDKKLRDNKTGLTAKEQLNLMKKQHLFIKKKMKYILRYWLSYVNIVLLDIVLMN